MLDDQIFCSIAVHRFHRSVVIWLDELVQTSASLWSYFFRQAECRIHFVYWLSGKATARVFKKVEQGYALTCDVIELPSRRRIGDGQ